tara:strand:+ start:117 stop:371 length:255 start_codon:yes stop_codon:yes gene_type:complete
VNRFDFIADKATNDTQCNSNIEYVKFHAFNKNGVFALSQNSILDGGAYFSLEYHKSELLKLVRRSRVRYFDATYHVKIIQELIK